jgi:hypothetical protein
MGKNKVKKTDPNQLTEKTQIWKKKRECHGIPQR